MAPGRTSAPPPALCSSLLFHNNVRDSLTYLASPRLAYFFIFYLPSPTTRSGRTTLRRPGSQRFPTEVPAVESWVLITPEGGGVRNVFGKVVPRPGVHPRPGLPRGAPGPPGAWQNQLAPPAAVVVRIRQGDLAPGPIQCSGVLCGQGDSYRVRHWLGPPWWLSW